MTNREQVLQQALSLTPEDRAYVVAALIESSLTTANTDVGEASASLLLELQRRSAAYRTGAIVARTASEVLADQRRRHGAGT